MYFSLFSRIGICIFHFFIAFYNNFYLCNKNPLIQDQTEMEKKLLRKEDESETENDADINENEDEDDCFDEEESEGEGLLNEREDEVDDDASEVTGSDFSYERDVEDAKTVQAKRNKLPRSAVDDQFFNLAEMNTFLNEQDKVEERKKQRNLGNFDNADEMEELIKSYEEENLKSRNWALSGEVIADKRRKDELLEQYVEVDYRAAAPPTITEEKSQQLESIIAKRIKENLFDDVIRKVRINEALVPAHRNSTQAIEQNVRKSLAEIYGGKYSEQINDEQQNDTRQDKSKLDPEVEGIKKDLDALFLKLDALSHFQFRPQPISEEVKIVNNMPSLRMEEVGPSASVDPEVNLLAPEEVVRHLKAAPKADEERTETDRKRQRRQKKKKQHILASIGAMSGNEGESGTNRLNNEKESKKAKKYQRNNNKRKLDFADQMQTLMNGGGEEKKRKMKKKKK